MPHSPMTDRNPTHYLKRFGRDVHTSQHFRELVQNAIEADATDIEIFVEPTLEKNDIHKVCVRDNGHGMTAEEMFKYLGSMNSSSKSSNSEHHENYGIGAKATTAYHNPYGVVFLSWTKEQDTGNLVWLSLENEQFGMKSFDMTYEIEDDEGNVIGEETSPIVSYINGKATNVVPLHHEDYGDFIWDGVNWNSHRPSCGHGSVVVLMGNHLEDNTWKDSEGKPYSRRELSHYLNQRYARIPEDISIKVSPVSGWAHIAYDIVGLVKSFETKGFFKQREFVECPNDFKVEVIITEKHGDWKKKYGTKRHGSGSPLLNIFASKEIEKGFVAVQYDNDKTSELYNIERGINVARSWGISADSVIPQVKLIVHPPKYDGVRGVYPNEGRDILLWSDTEKLNGTRKLDLTKVKEHFIDNMPQTLRNMIDEAFQSYKGKQVDITNILNRYNSIFKPRKNLDSVLASSTSGNLNFDPTGIGSTQDPNGGEGTNGGNGSDGGNGSEGSENKLTGKAKPKGRIKGRKRKVKKQKDIIIKWLDNHEDVGFLNWRTEEKFPFFAVEDSDRIVVNANPKHHDIKCVLAHFTQKNKKASQNFIQQTIQEVYETEIQTYISHLLTDNKNKSIAQYITQEVLKAKFLGCHLLWSEISRKVSLQFR